MMVTEEPDYESDFDNESDIADLEEEDDDEENDVDSNNDNDSTNEQISTEEENSINNKNATNSTSINPQNANINLNKNKLNKNIKSLNGGGGDNKNKIKNETIKNDKNKQSINGNTKEFVVSDESTSSEIESEIIDGEDISKRITSEFEEMKIKYHQDDRIQDVEMEYTMRQRISNCQKYIGSSTDTNNDENIQRTFQVEVYIENQQGHDSDDAEDLKQCTEKEEGSSAKEETSADELSEDSSEEDDNNDDEENDNVDITNLNKNENENESGEDEDENEDEDEDEDEDEGEDDDENEENENDTELKVQNDNVKERNDKSDTSLEEKQEQDITEYENKNLELNEINLKAIITDQSGNLIKYSSEASVNESTTTLNKKAAKSTTDSSISIEISSRRPSSFNSDEYPLRLNCVNKRRSTPDLRTKQNQNRNLSFSNTRMREIERSNQVLLKKILTQKSTYEAKSKQKKNVKNNTRQTSAAINRKKQQRQIDIDNQVLKRKLEAIAFRNRHH